MVLTDAKKGRQLLDRGNDSNVYALPNGLVAKVFRNKVGEYGDNFGRRLAEGDADSAESLGAFLQLWYRHKIANILFPGKFLDFVDADWREPPAALLSRRRDFDDIYEDFRKKYRKNEIDDKGFFVRNGDHAKFGPVHAHALRLSQTAGFARLKQRILQAGFDINIHLINIGMENGGLVFIEPILKLDSARLRRYLHSPEASDVSESDKKRAIALLERHDNLLEERRKMAIMK